MLLFKKDAAQQVRFLGKKISDELAEKYAGKVLSYKQLKHADADDLKLLEDLRKLVGEGVANKWVFSELYQNARRLHEELQKQHKSGGMSNEIYALTKHIEELSKQVGEEYVAWRREVQSNSFAALSNYIGNAHGRHSLSEDTLRKHVRAGLESIHDQRFAQFANEAEKIDEKYYQQMMRNIMSVRRATLFGRRAVVSRVSETDEWVDFHLGQPSAQFPLKHRVSKQFVPFSKHLKNFKKELELFGATIEGILLFLDEEQRKRKKEQQYFVLRIPRTFHVMAHSDYSIQISANNQYLRQFLDEAIMHHAKVYLTTPTNFEAYRLYKDEVYDIQERIVNKIAVEIMEEIEKYANMPAEQRAKALREYILRTHIV